MGHVCGDITTHYSAAELGELLAAAEKVMDRGIAETPALTLIRRNALGVGNAGRTKKRVRGVTRRSGPLSFLMIVR